ncbi:phage major capsid protein [Lichenicola cladoniae]|uniref:Phage major capsid protein n=1 Tax=Lichenicola cladoniae TaxID=1484109 RepID=A0A6M8HN30_9PROT|nr:phage major capsid protein [Lichenicola cladoniae]NPD67291.1 phage major capsid protein [Acetobacteraceae bacterium]QKE89794.1 phage major capsid protein [Lichenicola cladoniae]
MKLSDLLRKRSNLITEAKALRIKEEGLPDGEAPAQDDLDRGTAIMAEISVLSGSIDRLQSLMALEADAADPITDPVDGDPLNDEERGMRDMQLRRFTHHGSGEPAALKERGFKAARFMIGLWHAKSGSMSGAAAFIQRRFGDAEVAKALNTAGTATGGALIPQNFIPDLIELLRAATVVRDSDPMIIPMPMGNATIPRLAAGATAGYQGELDDIGVSQETFDDLQLNAKKLTAMVPVSNDLIRRAPIGVEAIVRDDLIQTLARREDLAFLVGDGSGNSPIGLLNLCAAANKLTVLPFTDTTNNALVVGVVSQVLQGMLLLLEQGFSRMIRPRWIMPPVVKSFLLTLRDGVGNYVFKDEIATGTLLGIPYKTTAQLPTNLNTAANGAAVNNGAYLMLADFADVVIGETYNILVDASDVASYKDGGGNTVSGFQRDQTVFRVISEHDFNIRHQASLAIAVLPGWNPAGYTPYGGAAYYVQAPSGDGSAAASTWGTPPTGSNLPGNSAAAVAGGTLPGRA